MCLQWTAGEEGCASELKSKSDEVKTTPTGSYKAKHHRYSTLSGGLHCRALNNVHYSTLEFPHNMTSHFSLLCMPICIHGNNTLMSKHK